MASAASPFDPVRVGPLLLRNRFIKAATNEGMARGGVPSQMLVEHHRTIAAGGAAMTSVAYCAVTADGRTFADQICLTEAVIPHLRKLTDAVHREGAAACAQITHAGAFTFLPGLSTRRPCSASGGFNPPGVMSGRLLRSAMSALDLQKVRSEFVTAARLAREAGFDAVEIHMSHGYLLSQFLSPKYNGRRDRYGGDAQRRAQFPREVLGSVLEAVGRDLAVICKVSVTDGCPNGATTEDCAVVARVLETEGAHLLVLSGGLNVESPWMIFGNALPAEAVAVPGNPLLRLANRIVKGREPADLQFREMYLLEYSRQIRRAVQLPLAYLGGVKSLASAERALAEGFDCVAMARALVHDPGLINRFRDGVTASGCTSCNRCVITMYAPGGTSCVLHPPNDAELNQLPAA